MNIFGKFVFVYTCIFFTCALCLYRFILYIFIYFQFFEDLNIYIALALNKALGLSLTALSSRATTSAMHLPATHAAMQEI